MCISKPPPLRHHQTTHMYAQVPPVVESPLLANLSILAKKKLRNVVVLSRYFSSVTTTTTTALAFLLSCMLVVGVGAECNPSTTNGQGTYCSGRADGFDQGSWNKDGCQALSGGRQCPCSCYNYDGVMKKCKSGYDSSKGFCYTQESTCQKCPHGQGLDGCGCDTNTWDCSPGTCITCPDGTYSGSGLSCVACSTDAEGFYISTPCFKGSPGIPGRNTVFSDCPAGYTCPAGQKVACDPGYYCEGGTAQRVKCEESRAQMCHASKMSAPVNGCRAGFKFESSANGMQCTACNAGEYLPLGMDGGSSHMSSTCTACSEGTYQNSGGAGSCIPCSPGTYSPEKGATHCTPCLEGSYQASYGQPQCDLCIQGRYSASSSAAECIPCPTGKYAASVGSSSCSLCTGNTYSSKEGSTNCSICPRDMTIYEQGATTTVVGQGEVLTFNNTESHLHDSIGKCEFCPTGYFTCNCLPGNFSCLIKECQSNSLCVRCPQSDFYCPSEGKKIPWRVWENGQTYVFREGNRTHDRILRDCLKCSEDTEYASPTCDKSNTICKTCDTRKLLITYADPPCSPTSNAEFSMCNVSRGDLRPGIGICNWCPPGSAKASDGGGCERCPRNTFSKTGSSCIPCPADTISGGGASKCTVLCSADKYSHDGLLENCEALQTSSQIRTIAQWKRVANLEMGAHLSNGDMIAVTNAGVESGGGSLWRMGMDQAGNVYGDDSGVLGRITALISVNQANSFSSSQMLLMADIDPQAARGRIRKLRYDFTLGQISQSKILTLIPTPTTIGEIRWPSAIQLSPPPNDNENTFFVADSVQHCIFKVQSITSTEASFSQTLWRGSVGYSSIARNQLQQHLESKPDWLLSRPSFMTPYPKTVGGGLDDLMIVMDDIGIWTFNVNDPPLLQVTSNLFHICGRASSSSSLLSMSCDKINFQALGSSGLTATINSNYDMVVIFVAFQTTARSGILCFSSPPSTVGSPTDPATIMVQELISSFEYNAARQFPTSLFFGDSGKGVFVTLGGAIGQVAEVGMHACLCDAGLYCDSITQSCVQSPVGAYSPSWSSRPIPCKIGTISEGPGGKDELSWCKRCGRGDFTTNKAEALNCEPLCPSVDQRFSAVLGECVQGCNVSNGEYLDMDEMTCRVCPIGSGAVPGSIGKGIKEGCPACQPPMRGSLERPGVCEPCPFPLVTIFPGATICMPPTHEPFFADGLLLHPTLPSSPPDINASQSKAGQFTVSVFDNTNNSATNLTGEVITSMSVNSGGLIFISTGNSIWKLNRVKQLPLSEPVLVVARQTSSSSSSSHLFLSLIEVSDDGLTLFSTEKGATCIWKLTFNEETNLFSTNNDVNDTANPVKPWAGICGVAGDMNGFNDDARLGPINGLAIMEVEGHTSMLFVSTSSLSHGCSSIRSISLYDGSITTFLSYDQLQSPLIVLNYCPDLYFKISIPRGTDKIFYSYGPDIRLTEIYNDNASATTLNYGIDSFLDFSLSRDHTVASMCSKADGTLVILEGYGGDLIIVAPRVWSQDTPLVARTVSNLLLGNNHEILECGGQHIWHADSQIVYESSYSSSGGGDGSLLAGCIGGFVLDSNQACMQVGIGQFSIPNSQLPLNCKGGTYGTEGGSLHVSCKRCPAGSISQEGALGCDPCPPSQPYSSKDYTSCLAACPRSTYLVLRDNFKSCTACPPGFFGPVGATSISECKPCAAGTYVNESTQGLCVQCPDGWSSATGSHTCVKVCRPGQCAADGVSCETLTSNWEIVTSVFVPRGVFMRAIAVSRGGGVFYTDNDFIKYFLDDCPAHLTLAEAEVCSKSGVDILPPLCSGCSRGISAMMFSQHFSSGTTTNQRYLYITSITTHSIYRLPILYKQGIVDVEGTQAKLADDFYESSLSSSASLYSNIFSDYWLLIGSANGIAGFSDGPFLSARFNTPSELDISADDRFLIISDFFNHRIRIADFQTSRVSTVFGTGNPCWNVGTTSACGQAAFTMDQCKTSSASSCASANMPIGVGLSPDGSVLYVAMNQENAVGSLSNPLLLESNHDFSILCRLISSQKQNAIETCQTWTTGSKSCMLYRPYDVIVSGNSVYVSVTEGITKIDLDSGSCQQIGGSYWDFDPKTSRGLKDGEINPSFNTSDARMSQPFRLALAQDRGILYIADMKNGAIRRVFIDGRCKCPGGSIYVAGSQSCYNPTQKWSSKVLMQCPEGQYALEGETSCKSCIEAEIYGISTAIGCTIWKQGQAAIAKLRERGFTYATIVGNPQNPPHTVAADWYGSDNNAPAFPQWDDIFKATSPVKYNMGEASGHAPWGGDFASYTYNTELNTWMAEASQVLQPTLIIPGFWYPCSPSKVKSENGTCLCTHRVGAFDSEQSTSSASNNPWHSIRMAAFEAGAKVLAENSILTEYAGGTTTTTTTTSTVTGNNNKIQKWSRFMILGSDRNSPSVCSRTGGKGPCFPIFKHIFSEIDSGAAGSALDFEFLDASLFKNGWLADGISTLTCSTGWPAHYMCPDGYTWVAPNMFSTSSVNKIANAMESPIACLSCMPGSFSFLRQSQKVKTGGPYTCSKCLRGMYSSSVGSTSCTLCPSGTYASQRGATACVDCPPFYWTDEGAQTSQSCSPCPPGSGSCATCAAGHYQNMAAQGVCIKCPRGYASESSNLTTCTPCAPNSYQSLSGMAFCEACVDGSYAIQEGSTACISCENTPSCNIAVNGTCGVGCGLNYYHDASVTGSSKCKRCPAGSINAFNPCAKDKISCSTSAINDKYAVLVGPVAGDIIERCPLGSHPNPDRSGCTICEPGTYASPLQNAGTCPLCQAGYHSSRQNQTSCDACPPGTFASNKGQAGTCISCALGKFSPTFASTICSECSAGFYANNEGSPQCTPCPNGTWSNETAKKSGCEDICAASEGWYSGSGATACRFCEGGFVDSLSQNSNCIGCGLGMYQKTNNITGIRECKQCAIGLVNLYEPFASNASICEPCPSILDYSPANLSAASCYTSPLGHVPTLPIKTNFVPCSPGTYRSALNTSCVKCPAGYVSENYGEHECTACYPGTYSHLDGSTCVDCDLGLVSTQHASTECHSCPQGSISTLFGTVCMPCPPNTYEFDGTQCKACDWGKTSVTGSTACTPCPKWTLFDEATRMCIVCPAGSYMYDRGMNNLYGCYPCPKGLQNPMSGANSSSSCTKCTTGYIPTTTAGGATGCTTCPIGQREVAGTECEACPRGSFSMRGIVCTPCYTGTFARESGSSQCDLCSPGLYANNTGQSECHQCDHGTFSNVSGSTSCLTCNSAENGYAPAKGTISCVPRKQRCSEGQYILLQTHMPAQDNVCVDCLPCAGNEWAVTTQVEQWTNLVPPGACPGDATSPGYTCIKNVPEAGKYLAVKSLAGSTPYATQSGSLFSVEGISCEDLSSNVANLVDYVTGPTYECYLGCKYGVATGSNGFREYLNNYSMVLSDENPYNNVFYPRLASPTWANKICLACPLTACPLGKYRPEYSPGCGPPCGLPDYQQTCSTPTLNNQGCIGTCTSPTEGAVISGGAHGLGNQSSCPWTCAYGYHLNEDETTGCTLCSVNICESGYVLVSTEQCMTHHKKSDICKRCSIIEGGTAVGWNNQTRLCTYSCSTGYYATFGGSTCISCTFASSECPIGTFRDMGSCYLRGVEPTCSSCSTSSSQPELISFTTHGGTSKDNCSGLCIAGYHTLLADAITPTYVSNTQGGMGLPINQIKCDICKIDDIVSCHGKCSYGHFRNTSVTLDTTPGACVSCTTNVQCGAGKYAPICSGNGTSDVGCHVCNQSILIQDGQLVREFVSYEVQQSFVTTSIVYPSIPYNCPSVCVANYVQTGESNGVGKCTSCKSYVQQRGCLAETKAPAAYGPLQPTPCDFIYSHWNATPGLVWWDFTPSFLPPSYLKNSAKKYNRGGFCWACPTGTGTLTGDAELCILLPGYGRATLTPQIARVAIPTLDEDLYLTFQEPRPYFASLVSTTKQRQEGRRLLSHAGITLPRYPNNNNDEMKNELTALKSGDISINMKKNELAGAAAAAAAVTIIQGGGTKCAYGWYKTGSGTGDCMACPFGTSTIAEGSNDLSQCLCSPGWYRIKVDANHINNNKNSNNDTNYTADNRNMACIPCDPNTFRPAATVGEEGCLRCPANETTHGRKNSTRCSCIAGYVRNYKFTPPTCVPCDEGTYCEPCFDGQTDCPPEGVQIYPCFPNSTSPPGSTSILNCTCLSGLAPYTTSSSSSLLLYYCAPVPPTAIYDPQNKKVGCRRGWTEQWSSTTTTTTTTTGQQLLGCTLCELGYYAKNDPATLPPPHHTLTCLPCPKGSFSASKDLIGNCTRCPYPQTTLLDASTSPESCGCPPPTIKGPGGSCVGCLSNQYLLAGTCANCPAYSISSVGATSISNCLCMPGYGTIPEEEKKSCKICAVGQYSAAASNARCKLCPIGSTTKGLGAKSIMDCGATADLCLTGYTWRSANLGCAPSTTAALFP